MTEEKKKMTAQGSSVGADEPWAVNLKNSESSIPTSGQKSNDEIVNSQDSLEEMYRKMQRMTDPPIPAYTHDDRAVPNHL